MPSQERRRSGKGPPQRSVAEHAAEHAARAAGADGECPPALAAACEEALARLQEALAERGWRGAKASRSGGVFVRSRELAGSSARTFRVDAAFDGVTVEQASTGHGSSTRACR